MTCTFCVRMFWKYNIGKELFTIMTCTFCVVEMQECYVTSRSFIVTHAFGSALFCKHVL